MNWKQKRMFNFVLILALVGLAVYFLYPLNESMELGLDLQGGTHVLLEAQDTQTAEVDDDAMNRLVNVINRRVDELGLTEPLVQRQGARRIIVELPGIEDPNQAIETIGKTAQLQFKNQAGEIVMTGEALKDATAAYGGEFNQPVVSFELTKEGSKKFATITRENIGKVIAIYLDNKLLTAPTVQSEIRGKGQITGFRDLEDAQQTALLLRAGALPVPVEVVENRTVGPTLGKISIDKSVQAAIIGLILIVIFMIITYWLSGAVAAVALAFYSVIVLGILAGLNATLTLPGIAGLILSIGMAVDANVIIFERIKYEYRQGKTVKAAVKSGFDRAFTTILDSNITTLITAAILGYLGTGTVRGFAITLSIGILVSMFTAIVVTRMLLNLLLSTNLVNKPKVFGWARR
ncbi:protein-export membrane protein SecD [Orenia metallireducens]|uniref:Protein translocase subunit SecD n=1 Tax=Orenia metallireducens TaxID=1413210 RepID=A0A1C0A4U6_9FIRM|nr:protein translocase subunit SecD [Orenia metallireducens]OCL25151.1 protein-export membrane protein SecD [Orenia metallireducens]